METFVVRIWVAAAEVPSPPGELRGTIEHVGAGRRLPFSSSDEMVSLIRQELDAPGNGADSTPISSIREP